MLETKNYKITCPNSGEKLQPAKVWASRTPLGKKIVYGQFLKHHHSRQECEYTGHAVEAQENK